MSRGAAVPSLTDRWVAERLPPRPSDAHKGTFGRLLVLAGSLEYAGAALLVGLGAVRAGVGLACLAAPASLQERLVGWIPEVTWLPLAEEAPGLAAAVGWRRLGAEATRYDAAVVGPGLGRQVGVQRRVRAFIGGLRRPSVLDADGLNALAEASRWWRSIGAPAVLTPHPVEFARLVGGAGGAPGPDDAARATAAGRAAVQWGQVVVLKGARTVVAAPDGELLRSDVSSPALATAGSGDVLAGAIGALLAAGLEPFAAAACGVAVHARAGLLCEERIGRAGVIARDIAAALPAAIAALGEADA